LCSDAMKLLDDKNTDQAKTYMKDVSNRLGRLQEQLGETKRSNSSPITTFLIRRP